MNVKKILTIIMFMIIHLSSNIAFCSTEDKHIVAGALAEKNGNYEIATTEYSKAISENPKMIPVYYSLGGIYHYKLSDYRSAIEVYKQGLELFPNDYGLNVNIMHAYFDLSDIQNGISHYKSLSKLLGANNSYSFPRKSLQRIIKGMTQEEIVNFCKEYLIINHTDKILLELLASTYMNKSDYRNAREEYEKMLDKGYDSGNIYFNLGVCYYYLGNYKAAKQSLTKAKNAGEKIPSQYFDMVEQKLHSNGPGDKLKETTQSE